MEGAFSVLSTIVVSRGFYGETVEDIRISRMAPRAEDS